MMHEAMPCSNAGSSSLEPAGHLSGQQEGCMRLAAQRPAQVGGVRRGAGSNELEGARLVGLAHQEGKLLR